ncbi:hypothetical protein M569_08244 [Genlisea aurea]|uniref:Uncharacterized protein n=1 Tax=Genlisea aurea TaxID=192259 RepID=S8CHS9_9LAMI|nr:hypothetical protein M569_08244 [Genlisea aurea]
MGEGRVSTVNQKVRVKDRSNLFDVAVFEVEEASSSENKGYSQSSSASSEKITARDIVSAVGYAWKFAKGPLSVLQSEAKPTTHKKDCYHGDVLHYSHGGETFQVSASAGNGSPSVSCESVGHFRVLMGIAKKLIPVELHRILLVHVTEKTVQNP